MSLAAAQGRWQAFTWGPSLALYNCDSNQWTLLDCKAAAATAVAAPAPPAAPAKADADGDVDLDDAEEGDKQKQQKGKGGGTAVPAVMHVRVIKFSPDAQYLASGGDDKVLYIWHTATARCLATVRAKKRISALTFVPAPTPTVLFGDRVGDVYHASLPAAAVPAPAADAGSGKKKAAAAAAAVAAASPPPLDIPNPTLAFGHLAALTELVFVPTAAPAAGGAAAAGTGPSGTGFVLSSDDEAQVRVSQYPHVFDIQSFCLHHRGFISAVSAVPAGAGGVARAVSGGGDAMIVLWNLHTGARLATYSFDSANASAGAPAAAAAAAGAGAAAAPAADAAKLFSRDALEKAGGAMPSFERYVSSMTFSQHHDLLAVAVNTVASVYLFALKGDAFALVETLALPSHTCGVSVVAEGANFIVSTRRIPDPPAAPEKGKAPEPAPVLGVDPLLSVFVPSRTAGAGGARFVPCDSKASASVQLLNGHFAALMASAPVPCDLPSDDYAQRERAKRAKFLDAATKKDERLKSKVDRKATKKAKKAAEKAAKNNGKAKAMRDDGDGDGDGDGDDGGGDE